jgi:high-affinity Fe2+/Pb2+ permease
MLPTYLLSLREGLEAVLIIGIVLGAVSKIHRKDLVPAVWLGTLSAVVVSILTAIVLTSFGMSLAYPDQGGSGPDPDGEPKSAILTPYIHMIEFYPIA